MRQHFQTFHAAEYCPLKKRAFSLFEKKKKRKKRLYAGKISLTSRFTKACKCEVWPTSTMTEFWEEDSRRWETGCGIDSFVGHQSLEGRNHGAERYVVVDLSRISTARKARLSQFFRPNNFRFADTQSLFTKQFKKFPKFYCT